MTNTDQPMQVHKYEYPAPLADGQCSHGRAIRYNLTVPVIAHTDDGTRCTGDIEPKPVTRLSDWRELFDADPACDHDIVTQWSGVKCAKCPGWYCA